MPQGGAAGTGLLLELLESVCIERMAQPARLKANQSSDRALLTIYAKVRICSWPTAS